MIKKGAQWENKCEKHDFCFLKRISNVVFYNLEQFFLTHLPKKYNETKHQVTFVPVVQYVLEMGVCAGGILDIKHSVISILKFLYRYKKEFYNFIKKNRHFRYYFV